ncbi:hypothetical protein DENSPDRAFT_832381 [Dentipellis sp. KUC8613]|nr:hypothetical protein DENSPDRAFT_832381 [Dentipellis sp. KUC8613]
MPTVTIIPAVPHFISPEEHKTLTGATPTSFSDIPPVLRHKEENVTVTFDPPVEGFSVDDGLQGTLYVIESVLVFASATGKTFQVEYPSITLHAISRADTGPFIYCQLDEAPQNDGQTPAEDETPEMREMSMVAQNASALEPIFESLSYCASLHPDPMDDDENGLDDAFVDSGDFEVFTGTDGEELSEVGRAALAHLESIIYDPHEQVPDANGAGEGQAQAHANGVNGTAHEHEHEEGQFSDGEEEKETPPAATS